MLNGKLHFMYSVSPISKSSYEDAKNMKYLKYLLKDLSIIYLWINLYTAFRKLHTVEKSQYLVDITCYDGFFQGIFISNIRQKLWSARVKISVYIVSYFDGGIPGIIGKFIELIPEIFSLNFPFWSNGCKLY